MTYPLATSPSQTGLYPFTSTRRLAAHRSYGVGRRRRLWFREHRPATAPVPFDDLAARPLLTMSETCAILRVSRWTVYRLVREGRLATIKLGTRRLVPQEAVRALVKDLTAEEAA